MSLFKSGEFSSHSGIVLGWKIDCDALSQASLECLALEFAKRNAYKEVIGIPSGNMRFAKALKKHIKPDADQLLIVDDVLTTGKSMYDAYHKFSGQYRQTKGVVLWSRMKNPPSWIIPIFNLHPSFCAV